MNITLFAQILQTLDRISFKKLVNAHQSNKHEKGINSWTHLVTMLFQTQFTKRRLQRIEVSLRQPKPLEYKTSAL